MWEKVRLGDVCRLATGKTPPTKEARYFDGDIPWLTPSDFKSKFTDITERTISKTAIDDGKARLIPAHSLFITCIGNVGKLTINRISAASNQQITALIPNKDVLLEYLYYYLGYIQRYISDLANNAVVPIINNGSLSQIEIPLPPLPVQQRIADTLDKADALRRKDQGLLKKYDELAQAIFIDMFGDPVKNEKGWAMKKLGEVCSKIGSGSTPRGGKEAYQSEGISLIRSLNIHQNEFRYKDLAFIDEQQAYDLRNVVVEENDVLFNITGASVCRTTIVPPDVLPARVNQHVAILRPIIDQLNSHYFVRLLNNGNMNKLLYGISTQGGATREAITKEQLENLEFPVPPLTLQESFARKIELINQLKAKSDAEKSEELFQSLLQGVFRGEVI